MISVPHWKHTPSLPVMEIALLLYVDDIRTSLEAHAFTDRYGDNFIFLLL
jgi:hypothetical protein